jgi:uncharacterized delta-60 repeat protein
MIQVLKTFSDRLLARCARVAVAVSVHLLAAAGVVPVNAQVSGDLDPRYAYPNPGLYQANVCLVRSVARGVAVQPNGNIVMAGYAAVGGAVGNYFCVMRLGVDGVLDGSFNGTGSYALGANKSGYALALQPDGKIVIVGSAKVTDTNYDFFVLRLNSNGTADTSFNQFGSVQTNTGSLIDEAVGVAVQPDGKIVVAGYCGTATGNRFCVYRYTSTGGLDTTFGTSGRVTSINLFGVATGMVLQPDGKIVVAGICSGVVCVERYTATGGIDTTFGGTGWVLGRSITDVGGVALQGSGDIVVATSCALPGSPADSGFCPTRIDKFGAIDPLMGSIVTAFSGYSSVARGLVAQDDGNIAIAGQCTSTSDLQKKFCVARYNSDGSADRTFSADGRALVNTGLGNSEAYAITVQLPDRLSKRKSNPLVVAGACENGTTQFLFCSARLLDSERINRQCSLDVDGDGIVTTKDALMMTRFALGFRDAAITAGITLNGNVRSTRQINFFLTDQCGM